MADKSLPGGGGVVIDRYDGDLFGRDAIDRFPGLRAELIECDRMLHLQMSALARAVRDCIDSDNATLARQILEFVDHALRHPKASPEIENAAALSFLEPSELCASEMGRTLLAGMPPTLKRVLLEQERLGGVQ